MNTRTLYFLRDSITKKFYTGQNVWFDEFSNAAIYYSKEAATKKVKVLVNAWKKQQKNADYWIEQVKTEHDKKWAQQRKQDVLIRQDLPKWGIEMVSVLVSVA
jgi:hypothetical protein